MIHDWIIAIGCWVFGFMIGIQPKVSNTAAAKVEEIYQKKGWNR